MKDYTLSKEEIAELEKFHRSLRDKRPGTISNIISKAVSRRCWMTIIPEQWRKELNARIDESELGRLRANTHTGRPLGTDSFLSKLEKILGRRVRPLPVGGPTKKCVKKPK
jgi:hypothetical protein